jgi:trehalose 6-phosphate phosphatase
LLETSAESRVAQFLEELAQSRESALLVDYDGTLAPLRIERDRAFPYPGVSSLLQEIMDSGRTRVVVLTGRPAEEIVPLLGLLPHPEIWGAYGLQRLMPDGSCEMPPASEEIVQAMADAAQWVSELEYSNLLEVKPAGVVVHWRGLEDSVAARARSTVLLGWLPIADRAHMTLHEFDGGLEIQMSGCNKGDALREFLMSANPGIPVAYLGDDQADEDAFRALQSRGLSILVRPEWRETAADVWLRPPEELIDFLLQWLIVCRSAE